MGVQSAERIEAEIRAEGFTPLGWFSPRPEDDVPPAGDGRTARTVVMIGNAGTDMWRRFAAERDPLKDTLDAWSEAVLSDLAERLLAAPYFPFARPPLPFLRWAGRSGFAHTSPLGMSIHPRYGLWHAYRAAFAFADEIALPKMESTASPCDDCDDRPCLSSCPVGAFTGEGYDVPACASHIASPDGMDCMGLGCRARRACPVGREFTYEPDQARFHMSAFLRARAGEGLKPAER